jgi:hypothetical protein
MRIAGCDADNITVLLIISQRLCPKSAFCPKSGESAQNLGRRWLVIEKLETDDVLDMVFESGMAEGPNDLEYRSRLAAQIDDPYWDDKNAWPSFVSECLKKSWHALSKREKTVAFLMAL